MQYSTPMVKLNNKIAVTGASGFIGSHIVKNLHLLGLEPSLALDSFTPIYGGNWNNLRQKHLIPECRVLKSNLTVLNPSELAEALGETEVVIHLAAFPGILEGEQQPHIYLSNNVISASTVIEACRLNKNIKAILFASSSSVYGDLAVSGPCNEENANGRQVKSHYAMTKWINEIQFWKSQNDLEIPVIGLRFFTVFGEWGRPDMAYSKFTEKILKRKPIEIYGGNDGARTMTHIDDVIQMLFKIIENLNLSNYKMKSYDVFNIASGNSVLTLQMVEILGDILGIEPIVQFIDRPQGDAIKTQADTSKIEFSTGTLQTRSLYSDLENYVRWHTKFWSLGTQKYND
jgi:UDP-glucuronate 4-epimerase